MLAVHVQCCQRGVHVPLARLLLQQQHWQLQQLT
jgi:hypothetical protein